MPPFSACAEAFSKTSRRPPARSTYFTRAVVVTIVTSALHTPVHRPSFNVALIILSSSGIDPKPPRFFH
jgi:hypothetical protein